MDNMPMPAIAQPTSIAPGLATEPMFWGSAKMPEPMVDPMMRETSVQTETVRFVMATNTTPGVVYYNHQSIQNV